MDEQAFLDAIAVNPTDVTQRLIFADWLEEQGDPRCEAVRRQCRFRMPVTRDELRRFEKIEQAREQADGTLVDIAIDIAAATGGAYWDDDVELARQRADEVVQNLDSNRLARCFPWDDGGRLPLKAIVPLARVREGDPRRDYYQLAIVAVGPNRRTDPQRITIAVTPLRDQIVTDDWRQQRWRWDRRVPVADELTAAGCDRALVDAARFDRSASLPESVTETPDGSTPGDIEQQAITIRLLDAGRFEDALRFCGVGFAAELSHWLDGLCPWSGERPEQIERVGRALRRHLWESSPWTFRRCVEECRLQTPQSISGLSALPVRLLLFPLPGQSTKGKWWLALCHGESGQPILDFVETTATEQAARHLWKRPVEFEIARLRAVS